MRRHMVTSQTCITKTITIAKNENEIKRMCMSYGKTNENEKESLNKNSTADEPRIIHLAYPVNVMLVSVYFFQSMAHQSFAECSKTFFSTLYVS